MAYLASLEHSLHRDDENPSVVSPPSCCAAAVEAAAEPARGPCPRRWPALVALFTVWRQGTAAVWLRPEAAVIVTDRACPGARPWVVPVTSHRTMAPLPPAAPVDQGAVD